MNKKVFSFVVIAIAIFFASCSKDDDDKALKILDSSLTFFKGQSQELEVDGQVDKFESEDSFVATVDENGLVTANHVGFTQIIASNSCNQAFCQVTVKPKYSFKYEPYLKFGADKSEIKNLSGNYDVFLEENNSYCFAQESSQIMWIYNFNDNKELASVYFACPLLKAPQYISEYLLERYALLQTEQEDGKYILNFVDSLDPEKIDVMVSYSISKDMVMILWISNKHSDSKSKKKSIELLENSFNLK